MNVYDEDLGGVPKGRFLTGGGSTGVNTKGENLPNYCVVVGVYSSLSVVSTFLGNKFTGFLYFGRESRLNLEWSVPNSNCLCISGD